MRHDGEKSLSRSPSAGHRLSTMRMFCYLPLTKAIRMNASTHLPFDEKKLWAAIQQSDAQAFQQLYVVFSDVFYNYGCKISPDTALVKDSIQDVFQILWEKRTRIHIKSSLKAYLLQMFRRNLIEKLGRKSYVLPQDYEPKFELSIEDKIILNESQQQLRRDLNQAIETLTPTSKRNPLSSVL